MATMITAECINCGACEPECPNTAIYQGGVEWEQNGVKHPPISNDVFYIVPEKCTECVGFYDHEACAAVCPVDVCIPDPNIPESEEVLLERAKELHPDVQFPPDFPSRFHPGRGGEGAPAAAPAPDGAAAAPAAVAVAAAAPAAAAAKAAAPGGRVERPLSPPQVVPRPPRQEKSFPGELPMTFDHAAALLKSGTGGKATLGKLLVALAQPLLGALPYKQKRAIEQAVGDRRFFTASGATGLNALHNIIIYPIICVLIGALVLDRSVFTEHLRYLIFLGMVVAAIETIWRMREGFRGRPQDQIVYRGAALRRADGAAGVAGGAAGGDAPAAGDGRPRRLHRPALRGEARARAPLRRGLSPARGEQRLPAAARVPAQGAALRASRRSSASATRCPTTTTTSRCRTASSS